MRSGKGDGEEIPYWRRKMGGRGSPDAYARSQMSIAESYRRHQLRESRFYWGWLHLKPGWNQRILRRPGVPGEASGGVDAVELPREPGPVRPRWRFSVANSFLEYNVCLRPKTIDCSQGGEPLESAKDRLCRKQNSI
jgi:hypothetical protein